MAFVIVIYRIESISINSEKEEKYETVSEALLGVVVSGALLFSAQAAELSSSAQDTLQSAMTKVQQEIKDYGQLKTLGFTGENCEIILSNLNSETVFG